MYCLFSKRCEKEGKHILIDGASNCHVMNEARRRNIPEGSYFVKTYKKRANGTYSLYVEIDFKVHKFNTTFREFNQDYIYLNKDKTQCSLTPFVEEESTPNVEDDKNINATIQTEEVVIEDKITTKKKRTTKKKV